MRIPFKLTISKNRETGMYEKKDIYGLSYVNENEEVYRKSTIYKNSNCKT